MKTEIKFFILGVLGSLVVFISIASFGASVFGTSTPVTTISGISSLISSTSVDLNTATSLYVNNINTASVLNRLDHIIGLLNSINSKIK